MTEYITKDQALKAFEKAKEDEPDFSRLNLHGLFYLELINTAPADVVEVVRCRDCKHRHTGDSCVIDGETLEKNIGCSLFWINVPDPETFYCSEGVRK